MRKGTTGYSWSYSWSRTASTGRRAYQVLGTCFASVAFVSGVLFAHYKRVDHYGSPLEPFFGVVFGLSLPMALICLLPSLS